jgi:hypothetical protein
MFASRPGLKQDQKVAAINGTGTYQYFRWHYSLDLCQKVTERACSVKATAFLTEFSVGKFLFSNIFDDTVWQFVF